MHTLPQSMPFILTPHPDARFTVREAWEKHYDKTGLGPRSLEGYARSFKHWERHTGNPAVGDVDNRLIERFRAALLSQYAPNTVRTLWRPLRSAFRRLAPPTDSNPLGLGIIPHVPYFKPVKVVRKRPRRIKLDVLSEFYRACDAARLPRLQGIPAPAWWRTFIVLAYFTGLRKADLMALEFDQFDLRNLTVDFTAHKTGKDDLFPLHPVAAAHLRLIERPRRRKVFPGKHPDGGAGLYRPFLRIVRSNRVSEPFKIHDVRRTAASEIDRIDRGLGKVFLQHAPRGTSEIFYLNAEEELHEAIQRMRVPDAFIEAIDIEPSRPPCRTDWQFDAQGAAYRGRRLQLSPRNLAVLQALVAAGPERPLSFDDLARVVWFGRDVSAITVKTTMHNLRRSLSRQLELPFAWNVIPQTIQRDGWFLHLPLQ